MSIRSTFLAAVVGLGGLGAPARAGEDDPPSSRDLAAARVVWETIGLAEQAGEPGADLVRQVRSLCEGPDVYCYENEHADGLSPRREPIRWNLKIDFAHGIPAGSPVPVDAGSLAGTHERTGAVIVYKENRTKRVPVSRVEFKALLDGVYLALGVNRPLEAATRQEAIERARPRWEFLVEAARRHGLLGVKEEEIGLVVRRGDLAGRSLADGEVVTLDTDLAAPVRVPLEVSARPRALAPGEPYELLFDVGSADREVLRLEGPGLAATPSGWRLETAEERVEVTAEVAPRAGTTPIAVHAGLAVREGSRTKSLLLRARDWWPVVTHLEVWQPGAESIRILEAARGPGGSSPRFGERLQFDERLRLEGSLLDAWRAIEPQVATRPAGRTGRPAFEPEEDVYMGFGLDPETASSYVAVRERAGAPQRTRFVAGAHFRAELSMRIVESPTPRRAPDGDFEGPDTGEYDRQRRIRGEISVRGIGLVVRLVDDGGSDLTASAREDPVPGGTLIDLLRGDDRLGSYLPLPDEAVVDREFMLRHPGTYELRFHAELVRGSGEDRREKKVDVAIRFRVVAHGFEPRVLQWERSTVRGHP